MNIDLKTENPALTRFMDDRPIRWLGMSILLTTLGVFMLWSFLAPLDAAALAPGVVTVKSYKKTVQHLEGGIVNRLWVKDGDIVNKDDLLVTLDGADNKAQLEIARGMVISFSAQAARLEAERSGNKHVVYPDSLNDDSDARITEAKAIENQVFSARKNAHEGEMSVLKQRIAQLESKIKGLHGQRQSKRQLLLSYRDEAADLQELLAEGFADKLRLRDVQRNSAFNKGEISALTSNIAASEIEIGETKLQILQLDKKRQEDIASHLSEVQTKLYDAQQRMQAIKDKVVRIDIKAPVSGRVMGLTMHTIGGVILPGHPILDIVPQHEELVIDAQVSPVDIDRVNLGLVAEVRFSAFKRALTPVIEGKVINLSADRLVEEKTGASYYQTQIELTAASSEKMQRLKLVPGMPVEVLIKTGERTVFEYLTQPITNAFVRAFIED